MKIKDVIKLAATYLNREEIISYLDEKNPSVDENILIQIDTFTRCANVVISELSATYIPLVKNQEFSSQNGKVYYRDLSEFITAIKGVYDLNMKETDYKVFSEYFETNVKNGIVSYQYIPSNYGLEDEIGYTEKDVAVRVLCFGVLGEFCLTERRFEESVMWRNRYVDEIVALTAPKNKRIKQRRFL